MQGFRSFPWGKLVTGLVLPITAVVSFSSCQSTSSGDGQVGDGSALITKVNPYHAKPGKSVSTPDQMVAFEHRRIFHGAVSSADYAARYGNYFTVFWKTENRSQPTEVVLEYRQGRSGPRILRLSETVEAPKKSNVSKFAVKGAAYSELGPVTQWRVVLKQGGRPVAEYKSFLWK